MPLYRKMPASPVSVAVSALITPSVTGTLFQAFFTTTLTGTGSRFLTQLTTSNRLQAVAYNGDRNNLGLITAIANNGSLTFSNFRASSDSITAIIPLDASSPSTGNTFITQKGNTAFTIPSGSYYIMTSTGPLGPYSMTPSDSNYTLGFAYDSSYLTWATNFSSPTEILGGISLVSSSQIPSGTVFYLQDKILRIA